MAAKLFEDIHQTESDRKATCTVNATGVGNEELATVGGRMAKFVKIMGNSVTLQIFSGTEGIGTIPK